MPARSIISLLLALAAVARTASPARAQQAAPTAADPAQAESRQFFTEFTRAARLVEQGGRNEAALVMTLLHNQLSSSPWLEISLLKLSELVENTNDQQALDGYDLILKRVANSPFFRDDLRSGRFFGGALRGSAEQGIRRVRLRHLRRGLDKYFARFHQYPENLAKLAIFDLVDAGDILDVDNRPFRYLPTGQQFRPHIKYLRYELETVRAEPFAPSSPRLESTTRLQENPLVYGARILMPGRMDAVLIEQHQTIEGFHAVTIVEEGLVLCTPNRVLVIPVRN